MKNEKVLADIEAEQAVLGALFFDATAHDGKTKRLRELASVITADDFYRQTIMEP